MEIFKLFGSIFVDTDAADQSMQKTEKNAEGIAAKLGNGIKTAAKWGTAIVTGATAVGGALVGVATKSASTADNIDKMSQKIGVSREAYQELDFICSQSGMSVDKLQSGMKSLTAAMDGAKSGTASNVEQFERLGIAVTNTDGSFRSQEEVFFDVISALQAMDDQTEKARLATELFGRSGTELMPLLNGAAGSIDEMRQQAHDLGLVLSDEIIDNGVNLTDSLDQTKRAFAAIGTQLGASLMPIVEQASDYIQKSIPTIQAMIERLAPIITALLAGLLPPLMSLAENIFPLLFSLLEQLVPPITDLVQMVLPVLVELIQTFLPPIVELVQMILPVLVELIQMLLPPILQIIQSVLPILSDLMSMILSLLQPMINLLLGIIRPLVELLDLILPPLIDVMSMVARVVTDLIQPAFELIARIISDVLNVAFESIAAVAKTVVEFVVESWESIRQVTETVFNAVKDFLSSIWDGIKSLVEIAVNLIKEIITRYWEGVRQVTEAVFNAVKNFLSSIWDGIKSLVETAVNLIKEVVTRYWEGIRQVTESVFRAVSNAVSSIWNGIKDTVSSIVGGIKDAISNGLDAAANVVTNILTSIKDKFQSIFDGAIGIVSGAIEKIKGFFNFDWSLPQIKLPHFKISGNFSLSPPSIPSFGVDWYKEGGVMMDPTVFGRNPTNGNAMVGGEAGPEAIAPIAILEEYIKEAVAERDERLYSVLAAILALLKDVLPGLVRMQLVLDTGALVGEMAVPMNEELGRLTHMRGRRN